MIRNSKVDKGATWPWLEALSESILHKVSHKEGGEILNWPARLFQFGATFTWEPILNWVIYLGNSGHWFIEQNLKRTTTCKVSLFWTKTAFWTMLKKLLKWYSAASLIAFEVLSHIFCARWIPKECFCRKRNWIFYTSPSPPRAPWGSPLCLAGPFCI